MLSHAYKYTLLMEGVFLSRKIACGSFKTLLLSALPLKPEGLRLFSVHKKSHSFIKGFLKACPTSK